MDLQTIRSLFTPSVLFLLLNLVIATIALISSRHRSSHHLPAPASAPAPAAWDSHHDEQLRPLARASSSNVLERVRSLGLFRFRSGDLPPIDDHHQPQQQHHHEVAEDQDHDDHLSHEHIFRRIQSDSSSSTASASSDLNLKRENSITSTMRMMKKSVTSMTWRSATKKADETEVTRPATMALRREPSVDVDAKADDFISKFRQQLQLQRLDSILRYKELLTNHHQH